MWCLFDFIIVKLLVLSRFFFGLYFIEDVLFNFIFFILVIDDCLWFINEWRLFFDLENVFWIFIKVFVVKLFLFLLREFLVVLLFWLLCILEGVSLYELIGDFLIVLLDFKEEFFILRFFFIGEVLFVFIFWKFELLGFV